MMDAANGAVHFLIKRGCIVSIVQVRFGNLKDLVPQNWTDAAFGLGSGASTSPATYSCFQAAVALP